MEREDDAAATTIYGSVHRTLGDLGNVDYTHVD